MSSGTLHEPIQGQSCGTGTPAEERGQMPVQQRLSENELRQAV